MPENVSATGFFRKNLHLSIIPTPLEEKTATLIHTLSLPPAGPSIVYVIQQKTAETVALMLRENRLNASAYHAGMKSDQRENIQNRFMNGQLDIVVATIAFGMGIDKRDIRKVIHFDLPKSVESYSQEIGRAGRDGKTSVCTVLGNRGSVPILENFVYGDTPEKDRIRTVLEQVKECAGRQWEIRLYSLANLTDIRMLPLKTLLVYLELQGIIQPRYIYFEDYPFKFIQPADAITARFDGERNAFVRTIFANTKTAKVWSRPKIEAITAATGSNRQRIITALDYFEEKGWIELQPKTSVEVFAVTKTDFNIEETADGLSDLFSAREALEVERIGLMIALFEKPSCLSEGLSAYFGETLDRCCGTCSFCQSGKPVRLPEKKLAPLDGSDGVGSACDRVNFQAMVKPLFDKIGHPVSATLATRFLCGLSTPRLTKIRSKAMPGFGRLSAYPYKKVFDWVGKSLAGSGILH